MSAFGWAAGGSYFFGSDRGGLTATGMPIKMDRPILPTDIIPVPVRTIVSKKSLFGRTSSRQEIKVLYMTRELYHRKYAKDEHGNYIGSESPAEDAGIAKVDYFHGEPPPYPHQAPGGGGVGVDDDESARESTSAKDGGGGGEGAGDLPSYETSGSSTLLSARVDGSGGESGLRARTSRPSRC